MRSARLFACLVLTGMLFSACAPKDPLDWKVEARTPIKLSDWWTDTDKSLPPALAEELHEAINLIGTKTPGAQWEYLTDTTNDPLCRRLDGHKIRDVIIEGYHIADESLLDRIIVEEDSLEKTIRLSAAIENASKQRQFEAMIRYETEHVEMLRQEFKKNETRIKQLSAAPSL